MIRIFSIILCFSIFAGQSICGTEMDNLHVSIDENYKHAIFHVGRESTTKALDVFINSPDFRKFSNGANMDKYWIDFLYRTALGDVKVRAKATAETSKNWIKFYIEKLYEINAFLEEFWKAKREKAPPQIMRQPFDHWLYNKD